MWGREVSNAVNLEMEKADLTLRVAVRLSEEDYPKFLLAKLINRSEERCSRTVKSSIAGGT